MYRIATKSHLREKVQAIQYYKIVHALIHDLQNWFEVPSYFTYTKMTLTDIKQSIFNYEKKCKGRL